MTGMHVLCEEGTRTYLAVAPEWGQLTLRLVRRHTQL